MHVYVCIDESFGCTPEIEINYTSIKKRRKSQIFPEEKP